jgi:hypothetical protein
VADPDWAARPADTTTPFVIEVESHEGPAVLQIGPQAAAVLAEELATYLKLYSR